MISIYVLTDYKNRFSSNFVSFPYRSGLNHKLLEQAFEKFEIKLIWKKISEIDIYEDWSKRLVLYTSSEDTDSLYKSFIEDIIYGLEQKGAYVIPKYKYLRAHNNKVFMEILRSTISINTNIKSQVFGTRNEAKTALLKNKIDFPCVIKLAAGSMSKTVAKADNETQFLKIVSRMSKSKNFYLDLKDMIRRIIHRGYIKESTHRKKIIVQPMIEGLKNDWKVLVYGNKIFNINREVRKNDFRASGSHTNYLVGSNSGLTTSMMNFVYKIYEDLNIPMLSFDLAYDGKQYYMIEFQVLYFGTSTFELSDDYYEKNGNNWDLVSKKNFTLEELFAESIYQYIK